MIHSCDLCRCSDHIPIDAARPSIGDQEPPVVCANCGFVYVRERRSQAEVAKAWDDIWQEEGYSADWPAVKARLVYVTEWLDDQIGLEGKSVLDIGAGEGRFLELVRDKGAHPVGIEPFRENALNIRNKDIACFHGTAESVEPGQHDIVTLNWTLENCSDCIGLLKRAKQFLRPGGHICVATGSRILVPYKKPMSAYFSKNPQDTHCFRFSHNTLLCAFEKSDLHAQNANLYLDSDWLVMRASHGAGWFVLPFENKPAEVIDFFNAWAEAFP